MRSQLQSIFGKTGTLDQMDCTRMAYRLALLHEVDESNLVPARHEARNETAFFSREDQRHVLQLPDGRQLEYSDFGASEGRQMLLWYHDQAFGDVWFKEPVQMAKRLGLRIIGPVSDRQQSMPGRGASRATLPPTCVPFWVTWTSRQLRLCRKVPALCTHGWQRR